MEWGKVIYWDLAQHDNVTFEDALKEKLILMETFGYIYEDNEVVRVVQEYDVENKGNNCQVMVIHKGCIKEIQRVK